MINAVFYTKLKKNIEKINWDTLKEGNPGIGGTQYLFLMVVYCLRAQGESVVLLSDINTPEQGILFVEGQEGIINYCCKNKVKTLILNAYGNSWALSNEELYKNKVKICLWAHNYLDYYLKKKIVNAKNVPLVICVSENQYKKMLECGMGGISTYINNFVSSDFYNNATKSSLQSKKVAYIGALFPNKGCHSLIKIWKYIMMQDPDAELVIIGGSSVYGGKSNSGKLSVTDKVYEIVLTHLLRKLPNSESVKFVGGKSWAEIPQIIKDVRVGIVNPSHFYFDETFCMSAVEFQTYGVPVVSRYRNDGLVNTINHGYSGYLYSKDEEIATAVLELLGNQALCSEMSNNARNHASSFTEEFSIVKWKELLENTKIEEKTVKLKMHRDDFIKLKEKWIMNIYKVIRRLV